MKRKCRIRRCCGSQSARGYWQTTVEPAGSWEQTVPLSPQKEATMTWPWIPASRVWDGSSVVWITPCTMLSFGSSSKLTQVAYTRPAGYSGKKLPKTKMQIRKSLFSAGYICKLYKTEQNGKRSVTGILPLRERNSLSLWCQDKANGLKQNILDKCSNKGKVFTVLISETHLPYNLSLYIITLRVVHTPAALTSPPQLVRN